MSAATAAFVLVILAMMMVTAIITTWIRARSAPPNIAGPAGPGPEATALARENETLRGQVRRLEQRIAVLERIATDPAERTAREIESLR